MTDDDMDARLHRAGASWRSATEMAEPPITEPPITGGLSPEESLPFGRPRTNRRHRTAWLASAAAVAAVLVAGGGFLVGRLAGNDGGHRSLAAESAALESTVWQLLGYDGEHLRSSSLSTFVLRDGAFVADDTCDLYNGTAKVDGEHLRLADIEERFYNCTDSVGEITFLRGLKTLRNDPRFSIDGDRLTISGDGPTLHLSASNLPAPTPDRPTLTGATWRLTKVTDGTGAEHPVSGSADLRIDGNHLHASDTCNTLDGTLQVDYPILKLDGLSTTEIGCPRDSLAPTVDRILTGNVRVDFRDATLTLTKDGAGTLTYQWQPDDEPATDPKRLTATDWQLRSIAGDPASGVTLHVALNRVTVDATCAPGVSSGAVVGRGQLAAFEFPQQAASSCPPEVSSVYEAVGAGPALWRIAGGQLVLNHAGAQGYALVFDPEKNVPAATVELPGTWTLVSFEQNDGNDQSSTGGSDTGVTLTIKPDGAYDLTTKCGEETGNLEIAPLTFTLKETKGMTSTGCHDQFDSAMKKAFVGTVEWSVSGGQLKLTNGSATLTFER